MRYDLQVPRDEWLLLSPGELLHFGAFGEQSWEVRAVSSDWRFVICTYQPPDDVIYYTVIDQQRGVRGADNFHSLGYETPEEIASAMSMFESGEAEVSWRSGNHVLLDITKRVPVLP